MALTPDQGGTHAKGQPEAMAVSVVIPRPWAQVQEQLRPLSRRERDRLAEGIQRLGYQGPPIYVLPDGRIIDGHHRFALLGTTAPVAVLDVSEQDGLALAVAHNLNRRHLTPEQIDELYETQRRVGLALRADGKTQVEAADATGVTQQTVSHWDRGETRDASNTKRCKASTDQRLSVPKSTRAKIATRLTAGETQAQVAADYGTRPPASWPAPSRKDVRGGVPG